MRFCSDVGQIGFAALIERRGNADKDGVGFLSAREIIGRAKCLLLTNCWIYSEECARCSRTSRIEHGHLAGIGIKPVTLCPASAKRNASGNPT